MELCKSPGKGAAWMMLAAGVLLQPECGFHKPSVFTSSVSFTLQEDLVGEMFLIRVLRLQEHGYKHLRDPFQHNQGVQFYTSKPKAPPATILDP